MAATPPSRPLALVTGASSGIGAALARCAAADGHDLVLVARREATLEALAAELRARGADATVVAVDLTAPDGVARVVAAIAARGAAIDVLVNNAGVGQRGAFALMDQREIGSALALNMAAPTMLLRAIIPNMIARGRGRILNVASTAAFQAGPGMAVYFATKAYLLSLSEALAVELHGHRISVTTLCPGPVATAFVGRAKLGDTRLFGRLVGVAQPDEIARIGWAALQQGRRLVVPGWRNRATVALARLMPRTAVTWASRALLRARR